MGYNKMNKDEDIQLGQLVRCTHSWASFEGNKKQKQMVDGLFKSTWIET